MCIHVLAWIFWRGCRAGGNNTGGQDVTQQTEIKDTPPTFHSAIFYCSDVLHVHANLTSFQLSSAVWDPVHGCVEGQSYKFRVDPISIGTFWIWTVEEQSNDKKKPKNTHPWIWVTSLPCHRAFSSAHWSSRVYGTIFYYEYSTTEA